MKQNSNSYIGNMHVRISYTEKSSDRHTHDKNHTAFLWYVFWLGYLVS